ncbi:MAG TPA: cupin domain-containing protein [Polyangiaceae bacterium]|jgi:uncharacterized cupin superfamily protein|nr:cupin domain-containing protein [Polyangiaceae bacterium]
MSERRHPNVINRDEVQAVPMAKGKHQMSLRRFGPSTGGQTLGATLTEVAPGAISYPFHYHCATEEALFILRGNGIARIGEARVEVREGDWVSFPVGPDHPHQMINTGTEPLVYLCVSANSAKMDIVAYPDSKKVAASAGTFDKPIQRWISRQGESLDYWDGEPSAS